MRGNTNPCSVCDYCDDSCDVCLHQAYEDTVAGRYREAAAPSSDEEGAWGGDASTDVDSASDEEGSWFTTPWSQLITQRVAGYEVDPAIGVQLAPLEDDEDGADGEGEQRAKEERHRRKKRVSFGTRRPKNSKTGRNGDVTLETGTCSELNNSNMNYDSMSNEEKKNLLMQICGVISVSTRKLCTRSMRCSQHSDEQRRAVRAALLNSQGSDMNSTPDMLQVDIDSYEDGDGQSMCESLGQSWEQEHSNTSSPADSASTSSSSSKKREKNTKTQE